MTDSCFDVGFLLVCLSVATQWADPQFNGVNTASQYHNFVSSGAHKVHSLEHPISYKTRREPGIDVAVGRGGNLVSWA